MPEGAAEVFLQGAEAQAVAKGWSWMRIVAQRQEAFKHFFFPRRRRRRRHKGPFRHHFIYLFIFFFLPPESHFKLPK